jgi:hypothetical protein
MPNPIGAKPGFEKAIGERVHKIAAEGSANPDDTVDLSDWLERQDNEPMPANAEVKLGEPSDTKWVVIPDLEAIDKGFANLPPAGMYPLRTQYLKQAFNENKEEMLRLAEKHPDEVERQIIIDFLKAIPAPVGTMTTKDFFYFRLGEYCVSQCY